MSKKLSLITISLIVSINFITAQVKVADSLHQLLLSHTKDDTVRLNILNDLAYELRRTKQTVLDSLSKRANNNAGKPNDQKRKENALPQQRSRLNAKVKQKPS